MARPVLLAIGAALLLAAAPRAAAAQFGVTLLGGAYVPASDFYELRGAADDLRVERAATLGLGANVDFAPFRLSVAYATGATLNEAGVQNGRDAGDGSVLAAAASFVLRPLPRVLAQPYLLAGLGLKREHFSFRDDVTAGNPLPRSQSDVAVQIGLGADLMLGGFGVVIEVTDYISRRDSGFGSHDAFALIGLRLQL
jgi:hypothetical protein